MTEGKYQGYLFLIQTALGNPQLGPPFDMKAKFSENRSFYNYTCNFNSLYSEGIKIPIFAPKDQITLDGVKVIVPKYLLDPTSFRCGESYNTYILQNSSQQRIRYLVSYILETE